MKKHIALFLSMCISMSLIAPAHVYASEHTARTITIFRVEGDNATLSRGGTRAFTPRINQRLSIGNEIRTGKDTFVFLRLDDDSIIKIDQESQVEVGSTRNNLSLTVQSGNALVNATMQGPGQSLEVRIGNMSLGVRGTLFTVGRGSTDIVTITMLSGYGEVDFEQNVELPAGARMWVYDDFHTAEYIYRLTNRTFIYSEDINHTAVMEFDIGSMDLFVLQTIQDNYAYLLNVGTVTLEMLEEVEEWIEVRLEEQQAAREEAAAEIESILGENIVIPLPLDPIPTPTPTPRPTPSPVDDTDSEDPPPPYTPSPGALAFSLPPISETEPFMGNYSILFRVAAKEEDWNEI
ncbi:MAG: FecR family protein [Defluviitaleaceae bacterium]|nr:FecR family protein [Defluviitaleaceae bacterium]